MTENPKTPVLPFAARLQQENLRLDRQPLRTVQVNIGKLCNQACLHCHVEAGPKRTENMTAATIDRLLKLIADAPYIQTVDITGGAPELNPEFRRFVTGLRQLGKQVIDRCNLTVLFEPGQEDTHQFLAANKVHIVASLPCYEKDNVDGQRGKGVFDKSVGALQRLNAAGYGKAGTGLQLDLVYNPTGPHLPPPQADLERDYKLRLKEDLDIEFNSLLTITNLPIKRYVTFLQRSGQYDAYMQLLAESFNTAAAETVMCRSLISVGYDGQIYDCDFNQMVELPPGKGRSDLWSIASLDEFHEGPVAVANHCYGCTAGAGSSCGGALVEEN